jgi:hypothetical protein
MTITANGYGEDPNNISGSMLTMEDLFAIAQFNNQVNNMSPKEIKQMLIELNKSYLVQKRIYNDLIKFNWGMAGGESMMG